MSAADTKQSEIAYAERAVQEGWAQAKPFSLYFGDEYWIKWATIAEAFKRLQIQPGTTVLDVGCGAGWTSLFMAQAGLRPTGVDLAPAFMELANRRADELQLDARFVAADMDDFDLGETFGAALIFDALHHSNQPEKVVANISRQLEPGGWVIFGEPSWLHTVSPHAREVRKTQNWTENGVRISHLKRHCRAAGLGDFRRFFEATRPYEGRVRGFAWQLVRLVSANAWMAPQSSIWLAAHKPM